MKKISEVTPENGSEHTHIVIGAENSRSEPLAIPKKKNKNGDILLHIRFIVPQGIPKHLGASN